MRVTQNSLNRQVVAQLQERFENLARLEKQMSTGLRIEVPSEDPQTAYRILAANSQLARGGQYLKNANSLVDQLRMTESAVANVSELVARVRADGLRGANGALSEADRIAIANEVNGELEELLRLANQRYGSSYLFGGSNASSQPFGAESAEGEDFAGVEPADADAAAPLELAVGDGERLAGSIDPAELFNLGDGDTIFKAIIDLRDALRRGDQDALAGTLDRLQTAVDVTASATTMIGVRLQTAETRAARLEEARISSEERLSQLADADAVETITRYNQEQAVYQMTLNAAARMIQQTLVNFL